MTHSLSSILSFEAPQTSIALSEPFAVQVAAHMAFLSQEPLAELQEPMELFELVSHPGPYHVKLLLAESSAILDITNTSGKTVSCSVPMATLKHLADSYAKKELQVDFCRSLSADEANAVMKAARDAKAKGGYATMMAFRCEGLSMDPKTAEALFGVITFAREQIIDRHASKITPEQNITRH